MVFTLTCGFKTFGGDSAPGSRTAGKMKSGPYAGSRYLTHNVLRNKCSLIK